MRISKLLLAASLAAAASVAMAGTIATISYDGGKRAEIYTSSGDSTVYVRTSVSTYNTGFKKNSGGVSGCDYTYADGDCYTESRMIDKVRSNMTSRGYER